jgi:hypothetical protein
VPQLSARQKLKVYGKTFEPLFGSLGFLNALLNAFGAAVAAAGKLFGSFNFLVGHEDTPFLQNCLDMINIPFPSVQKRMLQTVATPRKSVLPGGAGLA